MSLKIRPVSPEEVPEFFRANGVSFSTEWNPAELELEQTLMEPERMVTAEDDGLLVGTGGAFSFDMTIPGASAPTAGVTWIGVVPTHRRRGILTAMMAHIHQDAHRRGEPLAALWAAESLIYPRFGYGLASRDQEFEIERGQTAWLQTKPAPGRLRLIEPEAAPSQFPAVFDQELRRRPGMIPRSEGWWRLRLLDIKDRRGGNSPMFHVVYEGGSGLEGYVAYRVKHDRSHPVPGARVKVHELMATTEDAARALWTYCFNVDLTVGVYAGHRPLDDPLPWMLADYRRLRARPLDALWLRLIDVDAALAARRYSADDALVFDVTDSTCPWNAGRHRLESRLGEVNCAPTDAEPDIQVDVQDLGAVYLGDVELTLLAAAGRVQELRPGAIARADAMFRWRPLPWCPSIF
jgi:predicted acetyltransferase